MRIQAYFHMKAEGKPFACTGVEDHVTDLILPMTGDLVSHKDFAGNPFTGRVVERAFHYDMPQGETVDGVVSVILVLDRVMVN